jgi:hypothetical protein
MNPQVRSEDWLADPLMIINEGSFKYKEKEPIDDSYNLWKSFHFSTRIKLQGADYFLRQLLGTTSMPDNLGLKLLSYNFRQWYLDAFFFELLAAYECLFQELNAIYECGIKINDRHFLSKVKPKLNADLINILDIERNKDWFKKVQWYRNSVSHRARIPTDDSTTYVEGTPSWHYHHYEVSINYFDEAVNKYKSENIKVCELYLKNMLDHINIVWNKIGEQCFPS